MAERIADKIKDIVLHDMDGGMTYKWFEEQGLLVSKGDIQFRATPEAKHLFILLSGLFPPEFVLKSALDKAKFDMEYKDAKEDN